MKTHDLACGEGIDTLLGPLKIIKDWTNFREDQNTIELLKGFKTL